MDPPRPTGRAEAASTTAGELPTAFHPESGKWSAERDGDSDR